MKKFWLMILLYTPFTHALESDAAYEFSAGVGHQYAGVLGAQFSYKSDVTKYYGSLGLYGAAVGFETTFAANPKHTWGIVIGVEPFMSEDGYLFGVYNYHFEGFANDGFVIGAGIGVSRQDEYGFFGDNKNIESKTVMTLNLGYKF